MTANNKLPRGLRVLITVAILSVLIWQFAVNTPYLKYSIGIAALLTAVLTYLTYRKPKPAKVKRADEKLAAESEEEIAADERQAESFKTNDITAQQNAAQTAQLGSPQLPKEVEANGESPIPLIDDPSTLTLDEKNLLVNAVWYRRENPYCKYTSFLGVHYIVEEKVGGTNRLDNLIVLCPYCHDLAHRGEIPETEMREWISDRKERWKFKPQWKYF